MDKEWVSLFINNEFEGARTKFEKICESLFKKINPNKTVRAIDPNPGDEGIDVHIGEIGIEEIDVIQCKFFSLGRINTSQKNQIKSSFKTALQSEKYTPKSWTLCVNVLLDINESKWWSQWKKASEQKYNLSPNFIQLVDSRTLIDLLREHRLYNTVFELDQKNKIDKIHQLVAGKATLMHNNFDLKSELKNTSYALLQVKNHIEDNIKTHITRSETTEIINWIETDLANNQNNVLILTGDKGTGKSGILKDVYHQLSIKENYILGIKADKYYCTSLNELEIKLFDNNFTFDNLLTSSLEAKEPLVILIDQIDALSLSLSSNREFIETYNKLVFKLQQFPHVKVIISCRTFDLQYDAELNKYNSQNYKKLDVKLLPIKDVIETLSYFEISKPNDKTIVLLRTPNHLDIYCRIFHNQPTINLESIFTLKDLYDQLWKKYISPMSELKLKKVINKVAQRMYKEQKISVGNIYEDDFYKEIAYLKSNNLLVEYDNEIQFSHQTFYEYSFAKWFVEKGKKLEDYILENRQSLYVRSVLKMVIDYQRDYNLPKYIKTISNILNSNKYRFHVKSLIIANLGSIKKPSIEEKKILKDIIIGNEDFEDIFFNSTYSIDWVEFLISEDLPFKKFSINSADYDDEIKYNFIKNKYANHNWSLFINNIDYDPILILDYLSSKIFDNKENFISGLISFNSNWEDKRLLNYFEKYIPYAEESNKKEDNFSYYNVLEKIFIHWEDYGIQMLKKPIIDNLKKVSYNSLNSHLADIIKDFFNKNPKKTFDLLFSIYQEIVMDTTVPYFYNNEIISPLYKSSLIKEPSNSILDNSNQEILFYIDKYIQELSIESFEEFFLGYKDSNDVLLLASLTKKLASNPYIYKNHVFDFLLILIAKNTFRGHDKNLQLELRLLIGKTYSYFEIDQKDYINNFLLGFSSYYDYMIWTDSNGIKKLNLKSFGKQKYLFIKTLHIDIIRSNKNLNRTYNELKRKFGEINEKVANYSSIGRGGHVKPPLPLKAYKKMSLKQWKNSMYKYNESFVSKEFLSGNIVEHSNSFSSAVCQNPTGFYVFIQEILYDIKISKQYPLKGINGLIDAKYSPEKIKELFLNFITTNSTLSKYEVHMLCYYSRYFIENKNIDVKIVIFLKNISIDKNYYLKEKEYPYLNNTDLVNNAESTIQGLAISRLMECYDNKAFEDIIFSTLETIIKNTLCSDSIKALIISKLAYLNHLNIEKSFALFKEISNTNNIEILKHSIKSAQYFNFKYHTELGFYFNRILEAKEIHKECYPMITSWLHDLDPHKELYNKFINTGKSAKLCALHVAEKFLIDNKKINNKALTILFEFLTEKDDDIALEYASIILRKFKTKNFEELVPFLNEYSSSLLCRKRPNYFIEYLIKCSNINAIETLFLVENIDFRITPDVHETYHYNREPIQLILSIYSKLVSEVDKDYILIDKALNIFDNMLTHKYLRRTANDAIEALK
ncbi:hypothetical protein MODO_3383 [Myroides odoratimimus]|uniref:NACHT domain-containing protein n=1 Tax=Myroides odoratimimus TaxID=76832 RepID=UPI00072B31FA|nr:ATP-binding protein [Myroides odoratimimus]GAQ15683.1 hypothetical protein MODO_3383 [Myroides odoratimimus]STZ49438.1 Uncharacterised protein [Myroides odoratimimus]